MCYRECWRRPISQSGLCACVCRRCASSDAAPGAAGYPRSQLVDRRLGHRRQDLLRLHDLAPTGVAVIARPVCKPCRCSPGTVGRATCALYYCGYLLHSLPLVLSECYLRYLVAIVCDGLVGCMAVDPLGVSRHITIRLSVLLNVRSVLMRVLTMTTVSWQPLLHIHLFCPFEAVGFDLLGLFACAAAFFWGTLAHLLYASTLILSTVWKGAHLDQVWSTGQRSWMGVGGEPPMLCCSALQVRCYRCRHCVLRGKQDVRPPAPYLISLSGCLVNEARVCVWRHRSIG